MEANLSILDFPHICRICCSKTESESFLYFGHLREVFEKVTNIPVEDSDHLPKRVCNNCILKLEEISEFIDSSKNIYACLNQIVAAQDIMRQEIDQGIVKQESMSFEQEALGNAYEVVVKKEDYRDSGLDFPILGDLDYKVDVDKLEFEYHNPDIKSEINPDEPEAQQKSRNQKRFPQTKQKRMKLYRCEVCFKNLSTPALKKSHFKSHFNKYIVCLSCGKSFTKKHEYMSHCRFHYVKEPLLTCRLCRKSFPTKVGLRRHHAANCGNKRMSVERGMKGRLKLRKPRARLGRYQKAAKPFPCKVCSKPFSTAQRLVFHQRSHNGGEPSFLCEVCLDCFPNLLALREHRSSHVGNLFRCAVCSFSFSSKPGLKKHLTTHTDKPFRCPVCSKSFSNERYLRHHRRIHATKKNYRCSECPKTFAQSSNLRAHLVSHTGERKYSCSVCSSHFTTKQSLRRHAEIHDGEKSFRCAHCPRRFFYQFNLNRHEKNHKPAKKCRFCARTFSMNHRLRAHERTHTGEKPYGCDVCGRAFSDSSHLYEHKKTHTGEKEFQCEVCLKRYARKRYMMVHRKNCEEKKKAKGKGEKVGGVVVVKEEVFEVDSGWIY